MLYINIEDKEYELATTLRVAYLVQGQHNHANYIDVFSSIDKLSLEDQIGIIWASFVAANPNESKLIGRLKFQDFIMDTFDLGTLMDLIQKILEGVMGTKFTENKSDTENVSQQSDEDFTKELGMESSEEGPVRD